MLQSLQLAVTKPPFLYSSGFVNEVILAIDSAWHPQLDHEVFTYKST